MDVLILAAGRGNRISPITENENKCLLKIGDKTVLEYNLDRATELNPNKIIIVVGHQAEKIINTYGTLYKGIPIVYSMQYEQKGLVHAVETAKPYLTEQHFFLMLGDEVLVNSKHKEMYDYFVEHALFGICGVVKEDKKSKIERTYNVRLCVTNQIVRIIEKPKHIFTSLMGTGQCIFSIKLLDYIEQTPVNQRRGRNEKELPDLIQCAIDDGNVIESFVICDAYTNINTIDDLETAFKII